MPISHTETLAQLRAEIARIETFGDDPLAAHQADLLRATEDTIHHLLRGNPFEALRPEPYAPSRKVVAQQEMPREFHTLLKATDRRDCENRVKRDLAYQIAEELLRNDAFTLHEEIAPSTGGTRFALSLEVVPPRPKNQPGIARGYNPYAIASTLHKSNLLVGPGDIV